MTRIVVNIIKIVKSKLYGYDQMLIGVIFIAQIEPFEQWSIKTSKYFFPIV